MIQKSRSSSFTSQQQQAPCRPLIKSAYHDKQSLAQSIYIQLPYDYTYPDIKNLQAYLSPATRIDGVDIAQKTDEMPKSRYKYVTVKGVDITNGNNRVIFNRVQNFYNVDWEVSVVIQMPTTAKQFKDILLSNLILTLKDNILNNNENTTITQLKQSKLVCANSCSRKNNKKQVKFYVNKIKTSIILPKLEQYKTQKILEIIADDLASALQIMSSTELHHRVLQKHGKVIPIQNFFEQASKVQKNVLFQKLMGKQTISISSTINKINQFNTKKIQNKNKIGVKRNSTLQVVVLILLMVGLIAGYLFIKMT